MELPIIRLLPIPETCHKIVEKFIHEPHPASKLIQALSFTRRDAEYVDNGYGELYLDHPTLVITGPGVRIKDLSTPWPHTYVVRERITPYNMQWWNWETIYTLHFKYDEETGEHISLDSDDEDEEDEDLEEYLEWSRRLESSLSNLSITGS